MHSPWPGLLGIFAVRKPLGCVLSVPFLFFNYYIIILSTGSLLSSNFHIPRCRPTSRPALQLAPCWMLFPMIWRSLTQQNWTWSAPKCNINNFSSRRHWTNTHFSKEHATKMHIQMHCMSVLWPGRDEAGPCCWLIVCNVIIGWSRLCSPKIIINMPFKEIVVTSRGDWDVGRGSLP